MMEQESKAKSAADVVDILVCLAVSIMFGGLVFKLLWFWFFVPVFHVRTITIPEAIGLGIMISLLAGESTETDDDCWTVLWQTLRNRATALLIGWIVHFWV